jgi:hypothetical protein
VSCTAFRNINKLVGVDSLNRMFEQNENSNHLTYQDQCDQCGCVVKVNITKTSGGYGFQGGVLYETDPQNFFVLCPNCYEELVKTV